VDADYKQNSLDELFDVNPVPLDEFLEGEKYLHLRGGLSGEQFKAVKVSTQIYYPELVDRVGWDVLPNFNESVLLWGKGSGKDFVSAVMLARISYLLLCLNDPQRYYGKAAVTAIDMINMAFSSQQAQANFFEPFAAMCEEADCFKGQVKIKRDFLSFPKKRIRAFSGHSFGGAVEGKNLIVGVLDEIAEFKTQKELEMSGRRSIRAPKYSAEAVYDVIRSSVDSRFSTGKVILLSYPRYKGDFIMEMYDRDSVDENAYASKGATWDVNPTVTEESLAIEKRRNPERFQAKYNVNPAASEDSFFKNENVLKETFPVITEEQSPIYDDLAPRFKPWFKCNHQFLCSMHVDLSKSKCRAGIALTHQSGTYNNKVYDNTIGGYVDEGLPIITIDYITSFEAPVAGEIDYEKVREFIKETRNRGFRIGVLSFDGFQSVDMMQHLTKAGFQVAYRSVDRTTVAYDDLKTLLYEGRLTGGYVMPRSLVINGQKKPINVIVEELESLIDLKGKKIVHRVGGSKDEADALAGATQGSLELGLWRFDDVNMSVEKASDSVNRFDAMRNNVIIPGHRQDELFNQPGNFNYRGTP